MRVARNTLRKADVLTVDVRTVSNSTDFRELVKMLEGLARPYSVWVVTVRNADE
jgi:hypothetical protein